MKRLKCEKHGSLHLSAVEQVMLWKEVAKWSRLLPSPPTCGGEVQEGFQSVNDQLLILCTMKMKRLKSEKYGSLHLSAVEQVELWKEVA